MLLAPLCYSGIIHKYNGPGGPLPSESRVTYTPTLSKRAKLQLQKKSVFNVSETPNCLELKTNLLLTAVLKRTPGRTRKPTANNMNLTIFCGKVS